MRSIAYIGSSHPFLNTQYSKFHSVEESYSHFTTDIFFPDLSVIEEIFNKVKQIYDRVKLAQKNVSNLLSDIQAWSHQPLYERKDGKKENLLSLEDRAERLQKRRELVTNCSVELQRILKENCVLFLNRSFDEKPPETEEVTDTDGSPKPSDRSPDEKKGKGKCLRGGFVNHTSLKEFPFSNLIKNYIILYWICRIRKSVKLVGSILGRINLFY